MSTSSRTQLLLSTLLFVAGLASQQRQPVVGTVLGADGRPVPDATVTLVWTPLGGEAEGPTDRVETMADPRGRFVAALWPAQGYSAWATIAVDDQRFRVSAVVEDVAAGGDVRLVLGEPRPRQRFTLWGGGAWAMSAPLRLTVVPHCANPRQWPLGDDGLAPPLPPIGWALVVQGDGHVLTAVPVTDPGPTTVRLEPPCEIPALVVDDQERALPGATILALAATLPRDHGLFPRAALRLWRPVTQTLMDGSALARVPMGRNSHDQPLGEVMLCAQHAGCAETLRLVGWHDSTDAVMRYVDRKGSAKPDPVRFEALPTATLLVRENGKAIDRTRVVVHATYASCLLVTRSLQFAVGPGDAVPMPLAFDPIETQVHVLRPDGERSMFRTPVTGGDRIEHDVRSQRRIALRVLQPDAGPARGVPVVWVPDGSNPSVYSLFPGYTDQAGRLVLWLGGGGWRVCLCDRQGHAEVVVPPTGNLDTTVTLRPLATATIHWERYHGETNPPRLHDLERKGTRTSTTAWLIDRMLHEALWRGVDWREGRVVVPFVDRPEARLQLHWHLAWYRSRMRTVELVPGGTTVLR